MNVMRFRVLVGRALLLVGLLSISAHAYALGFGAIVLESHLNQKLQAHIPMLLNTADDINTIRVELATADEYTQLGLQWQPALAQIRVALYARHSDQPKVQLSSAQLMHVPMLSILLKAKKSGRGTYFKHYQLLLDAAEILALQPLQPAVKAVSRSVEQIDVAADDGGWARIWRYGPVQAGDSLSEIAYRLRVDKRFSNRQVMLSLYEHNRAAFGGGDINRLIKGVWLNVPKAEVVEEFASQKAMQKLTQLLTKQAIREKPHAEIKQIKLSQAVEQPAESAAVDASSKAAGGTSLRYSGKISMQGLDDVKTILALKQGFDQQFGSIHQRMMAGKLQMAKLDETVTSLNMSMQVVKQDIQVMKQDIAIIKMQTGSVSERATGHAPGGALRAPMMTWQFALIIALMLIIAVLLLMMLRGKKNTDDAEVLVTDQQSDDLHANAHQQSTDSQDQHFSTGQSVDDLSADDQREHGQSGREPREHDQHEQTAPAPSNDVEFIPAPLQPPMPVAADMSHDSELSLSDENAPLAEEVIQLLNQIEESLGKCEFDQAESVLSQVEAKWPDSLRASALKAQLFYETDRHTDMHDLINGISSTSDEQRWEQFCYFLPSHVWNACFGGAASSSPQRPDQA